MENPITLYYQNNDLAVELQYQGMQIMICKIPSHIGTEGNKWQIRLLKKQQQWYLEYHTKTIILIFKEEEISYDRKNG